MFPQLILLLALFVGLVFGNSTAEMYPTVIKNGFFDVFNRFFVDSCKFTQSLTK
ncbi:MAG: hypothetical protein ACJAYF_002245 [Arenicella sp.]|jgi:hypothetical protein